MREHMGLFRGKRIDNGEWVEGNLFAPENYPPEIMWYTAKRCFSAPVHPDSIGECTGLRDKNGKLIFEHDLIRFGKKVGYVVYGNGCFSIQHIDSMNRPAIDIVMWEFDVEIIGNVHDNPELLKGGEENAAD